jgi:hypothetical protein
MNLHVHEKTFSKTMACRFIEQSNLMSGSATEAAEKPIEAVIKLLNAPQMDTDIILHVAVSFCSESELRSKSRPALERLLSEQHSMPAIEMHHRFLAISPFTHVNGHLARCVWLWRMLDQGLEQDWHDIMRCRFIQAFCRQSLQHWARTPEIVIDDKADCVQVLIGSDPVVWLEMDPVASWPEIAISVKDRTKIVGLRVNGLAGVRRAAPGVK